MSFVTSPELDDEPTEPIDPLACTLCGYVASQPKVLGTHKRNAHGIAGTSKSATERKRLIAKAKRAKRTSSLSGTIIDTVLGFLQANRGPHHFTDIATELDLTVLQVKNAMSKARVNGLPLGTDGDGNWRWTGDLEVRASSKPPPTRTTVSHELATTGTANGVAKAYRTANEFRRIDTFVVLEDLDGGIWLAERIK